MGISTATLVALVAAFSLGVGLAGCGTPPGKGRKAEAGYRAAAPVIAALEKFHSDRGEYPESLAELVPSYLTDRRNLLYRGRAQPVNAPGHDESIPEHEFGYRHEHDSYILTFSYTGPGMNHCVYDSGTKTWHARGYY